MIRRAFAEQLAPAYSTNPHVAALFVGGSTARGNADRFSDLEIGVAWSEPPTATERADAIVAAGGDLVRLYPVEDYGLGPVWADAWKIGRLDGAPLTGVEVDMHHFLAANVERVLADVLERFDPDLEKQSLVGAIATGMGLHGHDRFAVWQERAATYPDGLRLAVVQANAQIEGLWRLDAFAERDNPVAGYAVLTAAHERLLQTLLASTARTTPASSRWRRSQAASSLYRVTSSSASATRIRSEAARASKRSLHSLRRRTTWSKAAPGNRRATAARVSPLRAAVVGRIACYLRLSSLAHGRR